MISLETFSRLVQALYAAPLQEERWEEFLTLLCETTGSTGGFFLCADSNLGLSIRAQGGGMVLDSSDLITYREVYAPKDPLRTPAIRSGKLGVVDCEELLTTAELHKSDMYRELVEPLGLQHPSLIMLTCSVRRFEAISFWRKPEEGPMPEEFKQLLHLLVPHIQAALQIRQSLGVVKQRLEGAVAMANASDTPTLILSAQGAIVMSNAAADNLLRAEDGLSRRDDRLVAARGRNQTELEALLRRTAAANFSQLDPRAGRPLLLHRPSGSQPLILQASPLPADPSFGAGSVLLLVTDPELPIHPADDVMQALYSFTPAEVEIANGLITGYSLQEIAALRQVSTGTVRGQVKSIFVKTGCGSQSDLVRLLTRLPRTQPTQERPVAGREVS
jgi:DNA-binding CsgD family transcriptional regulator